MKLSDNGITSGLPRYQKFDAKYNSACYTRDETLSIAEELGRLQPEQELSKYLSVREDRCQFSQSIYL